MIEIDGGEGSGSGTIVRLAVSLCTILGEELRLTNIRAKRDKRGLRPQHQQVVTACASLCGGEVERAEVGSSEITYRPGPTHKGRRLRMGHRHSRIHDHAGHEPDTGMLLR
jgi:RNA 3'-terminal phosphate cyclase